MRLLLILVLLLGSLTAQEYKDISFRDFLQKLSHFTQKNIVISGQVETSFNVFLPTFDYKDNKKNFELLRQILTINELDYKQTGDVILIFRPKPKEEELQEETPLELPKEYIVRYKYLSQADVQNALTIFQNINFTTFQGRVLVQCLPSQIHAIEATLHALDASYQMRHLTVTVIATDNTKVRKLGADWEFLASFGDFAGSYVQYVTNTAKLQASIENPFQFTSFINAMHQKGLSNIVNNPSVTILDGKEATVESTIQIPVTTGQTTTQDAKTVTQQSTTYQDVGLKLYITDVVIIDRQVTFNLQLYIQSAIDNTPSPRISSKHIKTHVSLDGSSSFFLGGINSYERYETDRNIPVIENIPLLGHLTRFNTEDINDFTFSVFITLD